MVSQLGVVLKISEISMHIQYTRKSQKWSPKTSQSHQNEVPRGTQSRQNNENSEKVKSNENINIYNTLEGLGHQNSPEFPCRNQQKTRLQSKCDFGLFKSEKIWKSDPERSPMGDPKSTPNCWKSILVLSECTFAPNDHPNNEKAVSQDPECLKTGPPRPRKINKSVKQNKWNLLENIFAIAEFSNDFNPANLHFSINRTANRETTDCWRGRRQGRSLRNISRHIKSVITLHYIHVCI